MIQAKWGNKTFSISESSYKLLQELGISYKIKKKDDKTSGKAKIDGHELQNFTVTYNITWWDKAKPLTEYRNWEQLLGQSAPLILQNALYGPSYVMLKEVSLESDKINSRGQLLNATITLTFEEDEKQGKQFAPYAVKYVSPIKRKSYQETGQAVEDLVLKILYNGTDITDAIDVNSCVHDMYACSQADTLLLKFNDVNRVWDGWQAKAENIISVVYGIAKTGAMYIDTIKPLNGEYELRASSIPPTAKAKNSKSWENVKFLQIAKEIADRHGLGFESYGVEDKLYSYVVQENEKGFIFLQKRCELESCAFVVYDKKLVIYSEEYLENQDPLETVEVDTNGDFEYKDNALKGLGNLTIKNGTLTGSYSSENGLTRSDERKIRTYMSGQDEANRFAKGIWRQENKKLATGWLKDSIMRHLSAGSIIDLKTVGADSWNEKAFVSHLRQDYVNMSSKLFFRKAKVV